MKSGPSNCSDGEVRLVGGESKREGRVEICYNGVWGTVCADKGWNEMDANVVCQQLNFCYDRAVPINNGQFGAGEGPTLLENVGCNQNHSNLSQCVDFRFTGASHTCNHIAGVICEDMIISTSTQVRTTSTTTNRSHDSTNTSHDTYSPIIYGVTLAGVLAIIGVIAAVAMAIIVVVVMRKKAGQMENR